MQSPRFATLATVVAAIAGATLALPANAQIGGVAPDEVLVRLSPEDAQLLIRDGIATTTFDYGSFVVAKMTTQDLTQLDLRGVDYHATQDPYRLTLGEISFDPARDGINVPAGWNTIRQDVPELRLMQFEGPAQDAWLAEIENAGLQVVQYIHPFTYVLWGTPEQRDAAAANIPAARWGGDFLPAYRVLPKFRDMAEDRVTASIMLVNAAGAQRVADEIAGIGGKASDVVRIDGAFSVIDVTIEPESFQSIAQIPGVYSVQPNPTDGGLRGELTNQIVAGNIVGGNAVPGYQNWLNAIGLDGTGVVIANVDGGIFDTHPDLVNRMLPCTGSTCGGGATDTHGTHTAGIMAGDGSSGTTDSNGFLRGLGVAPGANLVEQVYSPTFTQPGGMLELMVQSHANGGVLSGNSWGPSGSPQGYDDDTRQVDVGVRDADPNTPGNQQFSFVLSFMNGGGGFQTQGSPDEGKNLFNIGSTNGQLSSLAQDPNIFDLSSNTAHGPALDGRTIPHMVAPGCVVDSSLTSSGYGTLCGTSMASPHVSGAIALFIEQWRNNNPGQPDPTPAMIKAAFLATAQSLQGNLDADGGLLNDRYDSKQGWGLMDMAALFESDPNGIRHEDAPTTFGSTGETWTLNVSPLNPAEPVRIMLAWTDAPGHGAGGSTPAWNNDLDLRVLSGGNTFLGNNFNGSGFSATGGAPDGVNNTEGVFLAPGAGAVTIEVLAANINSDGVPGNADGTDQDFSLACYNCAVEPGFALINTTPAQDVCSPGQAVYTINVESILGYTTPVTLSSPGIPGGSVVFGTNPVVPGNPTTMTVTTTGATPTGTYTVDIEATNPDFTRMSSATLHAFAGAPVSPGLVSPANNAADTSLTPTFEWADNGDAQTYDFEIATDPGFSNIVESASNLGDNTYALQAPLSTVTTYYWRARGINTCGTGSYSSVGMFTTRDTPPILVIDDDDNTPNVQSRITDALTTAGLDFDVWDTNDSSLPEPAFVDMAGYEIVVWFSGDAFGSNSAGPNAASEAELASYIDQGGCLILSSQDYIYDTLGFSGTNPNAFMTNYLGLAPGFNQDESQTIANGQNTFATVGNINLAYNGLSNYSDVIIPNGTSAEVAFQGNDGAVGIFNNLGSGKSVDPGKVLFTAFPISAVPNSSAATIFQRMAQICTQTPIVCPGDTDFNNTVDLADLLTVLSEFGTPGIVGNVDGVGGVDLLDLLLVLSEFGNTCQ